MRPRVLAAGLATVLVLGLVALGGVVLALGWAVAAGLLALSVDVVTLALWVGLVGLVGGLLALWRLAYRDALDRLRMTR